MKESCGSDELINDEPSRHLVTIILHSGAYDRVSFALCIAQASLACGDEMHILLT